MCCVKSYYDERGRIKTSLGSCRKNDLILAEAMTIFNMPLYDELRRLMDAGKFGQLKMIQAPFGSYKEPDPKNRFLILT